MPDKGDDGDFQTSYWCANTGLVLVLQYVMVAQSH